MPLASYILQVSSWVHGIKLASEEVNINIFKTSGESATGTQRPAEYQL